MMDRIREVVLHPNTLMVLFSAALVAGTLGSVLASDWSWFRRSGSVAIVFAGIASTREIVRKGVEKAFHDQKHIDLGRVDAEIGESYGDHQRLKDIKAQHFGLQALVLGLVVSGFGDLAGPLLDSLATYFLASCI